MKKLILLNFSLISSCIFANDMSNMYMKSNSSNSNNMYMPSMYINFGLGYGSAANWTKGSLALDAMTMGFYYNKYLGAEVGMEMLVNGEYSTNPAMINNFHIAAKGLLPIGDIFFPYIKLGFGVATGNGMTQMPMMDMLMPYSVGPYYGIGIKVNIIKQLAIYVENSGIIISSSNTFGTNYQTTLGIELSM